MSGNGPDARRPLLSEPVSEEERNVISHPPAGIEENDVEQGCVQSKWLVSSAGVPVRQRNN
jgi:hypothetical protein